MPAQSTSQYYEQLDHYGARGHMALGIDLPKDRSLRRGWELSVGRYNDIP